MEDGVPCGHRRRCKSPLYVVGDRTKGIGDKAQVFGWKTGSWQLYLLSWGGRRGANEKVRIKWDLEGRLASQCLVHEEGCQYCNRPFHFLEGTNSDLRTSPPERRAP